MKHIHLFITLAILLFVAGCGIKRDNPLDPHSSSVIEPAYVTGVQLSSEGTGSAPRIVRVSWNSNSSSNTDGYFVYRSKGHSNAYAVIDTVMHVASADHQQYIHSSENDSSVTPGEYWYRVSAYKDYPAGRLEGRLSEPKPIIVRT
ncbi:MAG: hypothetical protein PHO85_02890 [Candidatus Cloacimonetes bacterium]|jgi:hypothetical protein|nr:hypothetical protein [Candidatus Cloacimonadota bacterium]MDD2507380.1 hypothetical protein [Candidatus Cloacimonadota bacterium]MDD4147450.1 hypothetical protein [Candidatus Cloacimonadota bacterium]MDD4560639.1 hypothetical protein [Candidatus Cloacimonadota bacterium]